MVYDCFSIYCGIFVLYPVVVFAISISNKAANSISVHVLIHVSFPRLASILLSLFQIALVEHIRLPNTQRRFTYLKQQSAFFKVAFVLSQKWTNCKRGKISHIKITFQEGPFDIQKLLSKSWTSGKCRNKPEKFRQNRIKIALWLFITTFSSLLFVVHWFIFCSPFLNLLL